VDLFLLLLAATTGIYLVLATVWDIKSREIYTFPCNVLTALWSVYAFLKGNVEVKSIFVCKLPSGITVDNYAARRAACSSAIRCS
jgi:hypothetical protein